MELQNDDYIILGQDDEVSMHVCEWLDSEENEDYIDRVIIETLAEIKTWQYRQNPRIPLRKLVLNRNLYNLVCGSTGL